MKNKLKDKWLIQCFIHKNEILMIYIPIKHSFVKLNP